MFTGPLLAFQDQAERLFNNAATFYGAGKYKEALADYQRIVEDFPTSGWADKALLEIGHYYLNVEGDTGKAMGFYERIQGQYSTSESAPAAYYWKAFIIDQTAQTINELEVAIADLIRMLNLYGDTDWNDGALFLLGKLNLKAGSDQQALSYFQRLEFGYPNSRFAPEGLLFSAQITHRIQGAKPALLIITRIQRNYPSTPQARISEDYARALTKFVTSEPTYTLDSSFAGNAPKRYNNPTKIAASKEGLIAILESKGLSFVALGDVPNPNPPNVREVVNFSRDAKGGLLLVFENRLTDLNGKAFGNNLSANGSALRKIKGAAVDMMGRIYVIDDDSRDVLVFDANGAYLKALGINKAKSLYATRNGVAVVPGDANSVILFDGNLNRSGAMAAGVRDIEQICFDDLGNLFVLCERGAKIMIGDAQGNLKGAIQLKNGTLPLKEAEDIAVDRSGALYISDRRGGSVYRLH
ncbi:MAG: outer membrane protein assembly factor BamD [Acidobacteria bacterium]|nr:outer membrane protein assembly factor BamD [Acidobacteriota bacterium]